MSRTIAILAGGLGTRVASVTGGTLPKALLPVAGSPFIDHKLREARRLGAAHVVLLLGHGSDQIASYVGSGAEWGVELAVVVDGATLLGTGGALKRAGALLGQHPWVTYGDTLLDADLDAAERHAASVGCPAVMTVLRNRDRWQTSNTSVSAGRITAYSKLDPPGSHDYIDYGYAMLPAGAFTSVDADVFDMMVVVERLVAERQVAAFEVYERFHDIGTPEALAETSTWMRERGMAQS